MEKVTFYELKIIEFIGSLDELFKVEIGVCTVQRYNAVEIGLKFKGCHCESFMPLKERRII